MSLSATMALADQINDEFLTCKICYEHYKEPKCLSCLHTFCADCIEQHVGAQRSYKYTDYREFACPICRKKTVIPSGGCRKLADNFLVSNLEELMLSKKPSKIPFCDICKIINNRERDATSKCLECQKHMCSACVQFHSRTKITANHSIFELDIEKDIMCKMHPNEQVRFYCETCEVCVCVPCTYTEHRDHELVDFKDGIKHHKKAIEDNLTRCRQKIDDLSSRCDSLRCCETRILNAQNEIHTKAAKFVEAIHQSERDLIEELSEFYGYETNEYLKKKEDLESFLEQLKSTCSLTHMVVSGKEIEMLLLKKQLCEKFNEFDKIDVDPLPTNISRKVLFVPGVAELGKLIDPDVSDSTSTSGILSESVKASSAESENKDFFEAKESTDEEDEEETEESAYGYDEQKKKKKLEKSKNSESVEQSTQMTARDIRELKGDTIDSTESQTDIRMIHELQAPNPWLSQRDQAPQRSTLASRTESKEIQTDADFLTNPLNENQRSMSNQSLTDEDSNAPVDRNKLGRRVRRHVKPGCSIAVLPSSEIIIIDSESNSISILDRRGRFRYGMSNSNKPCTDQGHATNCSQFGDAAFGHLPRLDRGVRLLTPQGTLIIKLINESSITSSQTPSIIGSSVESTPVKYVSEVTPSKEEVPVTNDHVKFNAPIADEDEEIEEE